MFYLHKLLNPILWTRTSEALYQVIVRLTSKNTEILEVGSGTGHISYLLARRGNLITLNDIRPECLIDAKKHFESHNLPCSTISGSLYTIKKRYSWLWNSGLIQCLYGRERKKFVQHLAKISSRVCLFYPDTEHKVTGKNRTKIPGVDDAQEYPIADIPELMQEHFAKITLGELSAKQINLPYKMYWIYGENEL